MGRKKAEKKRKNELKIIFFIILVAAALFIISTYAWFSTQRNVSITNLSGTVEVAEGLEISLDAETWSNGIVLGKNKDAGEKDLIDDAYPDNTNLVPTEMLPVSTLGTEHVTNKRSTGLTMMRGKLTNSIELSEIAAIDEANKTMISGQNNFELKYPGYFAFDIFLKNSSRSNQTADILQLNYDSSLEIAEVGNEVTGLQNTVRLAFVKYGGEAKYGQDGKVASWEGVADVNAGQTDVLKNTGAYNSANGGNDVYVTDVAIWEPNSSDHVQYIVTNNNKITWTTSDAEKYATYEYTEGKMGFGLDTQMPTYALTMDAIGKVTKDIYNWSGVNTADKPNTTILAKQNTLQTTKTVDAQGDIVDYTVSEGVQNLVSATDGTTNFVIAPQCICRLKVYVWLEGQDVDTINYASHGGGVKINIGLVKGATEGTHGEADDEPVEP